MRTWLAFLSNFNGSSFFLNQNWITNPSLQLYTDASGSFGYGAVFRDQWFYGPWPDSWKSFNIAALEFYPIVLSVIIWGPLMRNQRITFFTDNEALVHIINKNSCRDKLLMSFVRRLVLVCLQNNILFRARHVPGIKNDPADSLSCLQIQRFRRLAPAHMQLSPVHIPTALHIAKVYPKLESLSIFLVKHPSHQTEQAQTIVFLVLIYNLERGRIKKLLSRQ